MEHVCAVCKQPIDETLVIKVDGVEVHPGECYNYMVERPLSESSEQLNEVTLIL